MATDYKINVTADTKQYTQGINSQIKDTQNLSKEINAIARTQTSYNKQIENATKLYGANSVEVKKLKDGLAEYQKHQGIVIQDNNKLSGGIGGLSGKLGDLGSSLGINIKSFGAYSVQIAGAAAAGKLMINQLKETQLVGDKIVNTQYSLSQGLGQLGNNLIGVRVNILDTMSAAYKLSDSLDNVATGNKFADMFGAKYQAQIAEYDRQQAELFNELEKARRSDDQVQTALHMNRLRQIFDERTQTLNMLNDVEQRRLNKQKQAQADGEKYLLASIKATEQDFINMGTTLEEALKVAFLGVGDSSDQAIMDIYNKWHYMSQQVQISLQKIGYNSDILFDHWHQRDNILITQEDLKNIKIFDRLITQSQDKVHDAYTSAQIQVWNTEQAISNANKENENFEKWLERIKSRVDNTFDTKPIEKPLKTLVDLQKEQEQLRIKLSKATDPLIVSQLNDELKKVNDQIKNINEKQLFNEKQRLEVLISFTTDNETFAKLKSELDAVEKEIKDSLNISMEPIEPVLNFNPVFQTLNSEIKKVTEARNKATDLSEWNRLNKELKELTDRYKNLQEQIKSGADIKIDSFISEKAKKELDEYVKKQKEAQKAANDRKKAEIDQANESYKYHQQLQQQILGYTSTSLGNLSSLFDSMDNRGAALQFAIAQIVAGQAKGIGQAFATNVWYGIAQSQATQTSIQATIQSFKKSAKNSFATGGIVGGQSYQGDRVPIYQNSGEAVMTKSMQRNLLDIQTHGGGYGSNSFSLELRGQSLIAVQQNTLNKNKRINYRYD